MNQTIEANDFITPHNGLKLAISSLETTPNIIFGGDFNLPKAVWLSGLPKPGCSLDERIILNSLNQFCNDYFISHIKTEIYLTLFLQTMKTLLIHNCAIIPVLQSTSHHKIVMVSTCLNVNAISDKDEQPEPHTGFNTLNFYADEIDWTKIKEKWAISN